ncbi:AbiV family abortive infection protein [Chloroflexota bacterium]
MITPDVITHLEKYFKLSRTYFTDGDYTLAVFFAITTIEESSKVLILRDKDSPQIERKQAIGETYSHKTKYLNALINLIDQSPSFESLPDNMQKKTRWWWNTKALLKLRNDALYMNLDKNERLKTPKNRITNKQAALFVYVAGIALAELDEYISGFTPGWKESILRVTDAFRQKYLRV